MTCTRTPAALHLRARQSKAPVASRRGGQGMFVRPLTYVSGERCCCHYTAGTPAAQAKGNVIMFKLDRTRVSWYTLGTQENRRAGQTADGASSFQEKPL